MNKRTIKFRAWCPRARKIVFEEWGTPFHDSEGVFPDAIIRITADNYGWIWMQYTGLKDKNGVEIYEGDICKISIKGLGGEFVTAMKYFDEYCMFAFSTVPHYYVTKNEDKPMGSSGSSTKWKPFLPSSYKSIEVIGNIYSNPDLLKENNDRA